jgi:tetratricopeptide (TPR) repeat protein
MKKATLAIFVWLIAGSVWATNGFDPGAVGAMSPHQLQALFQEANGLYAAKDFEGAAKRYDALLNAGLADPTLYYNAGNAHAELGRKGLAVWNYEQAERLAPRDEDIQYNLMTMSPPENHPPAFVLARPFLYFSGLFSLSESVAALAIAWWIGLLALAASAVIVNAKLSQAARLFGKVALATFAVFAILGAAKYYDQGMRDWAVVTADSAIGRASPADDGRKDYELPAGLRVTQQSQYPGGWVQARLPNGSRTYLRATEIKPL